MIKKIEKEIETLNKLHKEEIELFDIYNDVKATVLSDTVEEVVVNHLKSQFKIFAGYYDVRYDELIKITNEAIKAMEDADAFNWINHLDRYNVADTELTRLDKAFKEYYVIYHDTLTDILDD